MTKDKKMLLYRRQIYAILKFLISVSFHLSNSLNQQQNDLLKINNIFNNNLFY